MGNQPQPSISPLEHPKFKHATITSKKQIVIQYKLASAYIDWLDKRSQISKITNTHPLLIPAVEETHSQNFCGTEKSINLIFPLFRYTLFEEICKRKSMKLKFEETELWFLLFHLLKASSIFERKRLKSGDIRPKNILIDEKGEIGVLNVLSFPDELPNYYKSLFNKETTYLAPEELAELETNTKYCRADPIIAESFSIGLTMVDTALLFNSEELYDCVEVTFKNYQFQDNLVSFKSMNLSPFFIKTVLNLLEVQSFNRPSPGQALAILVPYEKQIVSLDEFIPDRERSKHSLEDFQKLK